ncbi:MULTISPECIES: serine hydrolase domain-containing protein [unclassified Streptomyces]|uniref:serine hydrolase domain-containing protein n=1 Tax=unclassified Streptomyces TaxID=2593676 RepID=UPI00093AC772|nr:serine hydrolase domain-containing protein [Streptomyces sp. TSRI0107]OKJ90381.1 beta-lactamase [Streptomyces sp. TSRI0107]
MTFACRGLRRGAVAAAMAAVLLLPVTAVSAVATPRAVGPEAVSGAVTQTDPPSPTTADGDFRELTPEVRRQLDDAVQRVMKEANVPGVTVGLWTPDKGVYERSFGVADKSTGQRMSPDLFMRIGSETKTFTVTALLQLVDQGKVDLDDPISAYVDGVPNGDEISLRELAGMRSGLYNYSEDPDFFKALTSDPQRSFTPRQLLDYAFKHPVLFQPNEKFSYCNTNLILLGLVVEKVAEQPLQDVIKENILDPAGMRDSFLATNADFPEPHAQGYTNQTATGEVENSTDWDPSWGWAAGAMISTRDDLRTWARTVATGEFPDGGAMVEPATQKQRLETPPTGIKGAGYGLGIFDVQGWIGHNGSLPGYESLTIYLPSAEATLVVLLNTDIVHDGQEPSTLFGDAITSIVTPDHVFNLPVSPTPKK